MCLPACTAQLAAALSRRAFLRRTGVENVANLGLLPPHGATIVVGGPKIAGCTGGPCRVLALL